jgi:CBS domain-containing protein/sporulation protein YlmC with PRC-barrel domain
VYDAAGKRVGRVADLAVHTASLPPRVAALSIQPRGEQTRRAVRWDSINTLESGRVQLRVTEDRIESSPADETLLQLGYDLLDQQIIDVNGRKVVRVNDLLLEFRAVEGQRELYLFGVDIGLGGAVRRLLQGAVPSAWIRQVEGRIKQSIIPWNYVNLIEADPRRQVKLNITHQALGEMHPADLADIMEELTPQERQSIFASLDDETVAEALEEIRPDLRPSIIDSLGMERAADIVEEMAPDAAADVLGDLPQETTEEILEDMDREEAEEIGELLEYADNSAGAMMTTEYLAVPHTADVESAVNLLRKTPDLPANFNTLFLVDESGLYRGTVALVQLLVAAPQEILDDLKMDPLVSVDQNAPAKDVFDLVDKYNLLSLAVVDEQGALAGAVTVDDVVTALRAA